MMEYLTAYLNGFILICLIGLYIYIYNLIFRSYDNIFAYLLGPFVMPFDVVSIVAAILFFPYFIGLSVL